MWHEKFKRYVCQTSSSPLAIEVIYAEGPYVFDRNQTRYLDLISGIGVANIGHAQDAVIAAIRRQAEAYLHPMVYGEFVMQSQVAYAEALATALPGKLDNVFFANSGAEAVEAALKVARKVTGRAQLLAFDGCYHGDTIGALSLQAEQIYRAPFEPLLPDCGTLPWNDMAGLEHITNETAAVIMEPIQGEGGIRMASKKYMHALRQRCSEQGALLIFDEVMTGFGRTGELFAMQHWQVEPDLVVLAKALGGGLPLGACVGPKAIMRTLSENPPLAHVTTFGGNPVCCAAGLAAFSILQRQALWLRAREIGSLLQQGMHDIFGGDDRILDIRGRGCLIGVEFADAPLTQGFAAECLKEHLIIGWTLYHSNILRMAPPLILTDKQCHDALEAMRVAWKRAANH